MKIDYVAWAAMFLALAGLFWNVSTGFNRVHERMDRLQAETNRRFDTVQTEMNQIRTEMNRRFDTMQAENQRQHDAMEAENQRQHDAMEGGAAHLRAAYYAP